MDENLKKSKQLGMPIGTATHRLRKSIMFSLLRKLNLDVCFRCGELIHSVDDLSIEHKIPWLDSENPTALFFSLDNIAFSHLHCNSKFANRKMGLIERHGTLQMYQKFKCRCDKCRESKAIENKRNRHKTN